MKIKFFVFLACCCALLVVLVGRVIDVQLFRGEGFRVQADDNRFFSLPVPAERGIFLDRYGSPLVWNTRRYYQVLDPEKIHYSKLPIPREEALELMATQSASVVSSLERLYRFPEALAHVLGYTGPVTAENLAKDETLGLSDTVGKLSLELSQNARLRGVSGKDEYEVDALGRRRQKVDQVPPQPGEVLQTTLDPYLSEVAYRALQGQKGAVVIADAQTGAILSLVSSPSFDANVLTRTTGTPESEAQRLQHIQQLFKDDRKVFFNRAVDGSYPPGSVFKIVTALAGLEFGKVDANTSVVDEGVLKVGQYEYGNWYYRQYGRAEGAISLARALARSNDIYFYKVAEWVGPDNLAAMAKMLGFGQPTGVQLNPQAKGLIPTPVWKEETIGEKWFLGNTYHMGIGQGDVLVSPIQVAQMVQAVANNGRMCAPSIISTKSAHCSEVSLKKENLELVIKGMLDACSSGGTAYPFFPYNSTRRQPDASVKDDLARGAVACKTGTAEFGAADANDHRRTHGWFVAMAEFDPSQFAPVTLSEAETASQSAAVVNPQMSLSQLRQQWLSQLPKASMPRTLVFVSLVESDETQPFKEGSRDASPVIKAVIDWMWGSQAAEQAPAVTEGEGE